VRVERVIVRGRPNPLPKTAAGDRELRLLPVAREALLRERHHHARLGGRVWHHPGTGEPYRNAAKIRRLWREVLAAGVGYRPPYPLRRSYASWLLTAGEDPSWIAGPMGHSGCAMIRRAYARWIPEARAEADAHGAQAFFAGISQAGLQHVDWLSSAAGCTPAAHARAAPSPRGARSRRVPSCPCAQHRSASAN
jgi:hypothetical protein